MKKLLLLLGFVGLICLAVVLTIYNCDEPEAFFKYWQENQEQFTYKKYMFCPDGSTAMGGTCCKGGYAYNSTSGDFDVMDGRCGCPKGLTHSPWGAVLLGLEEDEKFPMHDIILPLVMSLCCKDGKIYDKDGKVSASIVDAAIAGWCEPVPSDKEKRTETLWEMEGKLFSLLFSRVH